MSSDRQGVIVTGAASGIGRSTCERLARSGWDVLAVDRDAAKLAWTKGVEHVVALTADITSQDDNQRMVAEAEKHFGKINAAIFNAGITGGGSIDELPIEAFRNVIEVNLVGAVLGIKAVLPALRRQKGGAIAITSSTMGIAGDGDNWAYAASKHALIGLVRSVSREIGWEGIRINALCPGPTETGMTSPLKTISPVHFDLLARSVALQRWADPDEMATVLEFLISPASSYVTGHAMVADGGAVVGTGLAMPRSQNTKTIPDNINR